MYTMLPKVLKILCVETRKECMMTHFSNFSFSDLTSLSHNNRQMTNKRGNQQIEYLRIINDYKQL